MTPSAYLIGNQSTLGDFPGLMVTRLHHRPAGHGSNQFEKFSQNPHGQHADDRWISRHHKGSGSLAALAEAKGAVWTLGVTNIRTFVDPQNPKRVAVVMDVPDMDALNAVMQSPAAAEAMGHDGVAPETLVILVEA
jgi:hypothetical protein